MISYVWWKKEATPLIKPSAISHWPTIHQPRLLWIPTCFGSTAHWLPVPVATARRCRHMATLHLMNLVGSNRHWMAPYPWYPGWAELNKAGVNHGRWNHGLGRYQIMHPCWTSVRSEWWLTSNICQQPEPRERQNQCASLKLQRTIRCSNWLPMPLLISQSGYNHSSIGSSLHSSQNHRGWP